MRPVLPRISSQASGFFFCGIRLLPVENSSGSSMNPNSGEANSTKSSASRERCIARVDSAKRYSSAKSRSLTASKLLAVDTRKTEIARQGFAIERKCAAGEGAGTQRTIIGARGGCGDAFGVAMKCFTMRQEANAKAKSAARAACEWCRAWEPSDCVRPAQQWRVPVKR